MALHATRDTEDTAAFFANAPTGPMDLTVLVDNKADGVRLAAEHGLSLLLGVAGKQILFDTGQGPALSHNAHRLGISFHALDALVLSHGHYDHTGGIPDVLRQNPNVRIFAHPDLFNPRYIRRNAPPHKPIGIPQAASEVLGSHLADITWTSAPTRIVEGVLVQVLCKWTGTKIQQHRRAVVGLRSQVQSWGTRDARFVWIAVLHISLYNGPHGGTLGSIAGFDGDA